MVAASGTLHMACVDPRGFGATDSLQHGSFDGTAWTFESNIAGSGRFMYGLNTSIALDSAGTPHVLYCRSSDWFESGDLVHATAGSPDWNFETITSGDAAGRFPTLAIDADDHLHATWLDVDPADHSRGTVQYATRAPGPGAAWTISPVATLGHVRLEFSGARKSASIALDSTGTPHIAFADTTMLGYATLQSGAWQTTRVLEHNAAIYQSLAVLRLDSTDQPGIALWQRDSAGTDTVRLARPLAPARLDLSLNVTGTTIRYTTGTAGTYQLQSSRDLRSWQPSGAPVISTGTPTEINAELTDGHRGFFRVTFHP